MYWLPNPFKSLRISDDDDSISISRDISCRGSVKEDLTEIKETIGRQLRGVAAFLAPPPLVRHEDDENSPKLAGVRNDLAEISGSFKSSLSLLSTKKSVPRVSEIASIRRVGITDEVVDFVNDVSDWPDCWTDFPLSVDGDGFTMTETQAEHISSIEQIVPSLADLKKTLRNDMSERKFWMIYFILLIPRLNEDGLNLLSNPEIVEARKMLLTKLRNQRNSLKPDSMKDHIEHSSQPNRILESTSDETFESFSEEKDANKGSSDAQRKLQNEDDISFSDLDGDDTDVSIRQYGMGRGHDVASYSSDGSSDWVRLNKNAESGGGRSRKGRLSSRNRDSEGEEPSEWLKIHELDYFN